MTIRLGLSLLALLAAAACSPRRLPGTDIRDTSETRAIYGVVQEWVKAMNERNAAGVLAQVASDYFDDAGTPEPGDDLDRERLEKAIAADLARIEGSKLAVTLRRIEVQNETAFAEIFYDSYYRVLTTVGPVPRRDSDVHRMRFRKLDGKWKIAGGL
jgi:ketosteroid isomerase-like protein